MRVASGPRRVTQRALMRRWADWTEPPWTGWIETMGDPLLSLEAARRYDYLCYMLSRGLRAHDDHRWGGVDGEGRIAIVTHIVI